MPYLSNNYRYQPKSKLKSFTETALFVFISSFAILTTLMILGWVSAFAAEAAMIS